VSLLRRGAAKLSSILTIFLMSLGGARGFAPCGSIYEVHCFCSSCGVVAHCLWKGEKTCLSPYTSLYLTAVVSVLLLFQLELGFLGKYQDNLAISCSSKRKSWKTGLLTPPKETAAARAVRLVPRLGYSKQGQVRFTLFVDCYTSKEVFSIIAYAMQPKRIL
jgi:hypothetical protein